MLALITAILAVAVLSILHLLQNRRQMAVLRSLGVKKGQAVACLLSGLLLVSLLGALCGGILGEKLASGVTRRIMDSAREDTLDSSFSAMLVGEEADAFQLTVAAHPALTWWSAGGVFAALLTLSLGLLLWEAQKPPLLMLGVKE